MARRKYLSLEESRKSGKLDQFAKEHPATGDAAAFDALKDAVLKVDGSVFLGTKA